MLWGTIINGTHTTTPCQDCVRLFAGRGLCITCERESFSTTVQPHTAHLGHGLFQSFHLELMDHLPYAPAHPACLQKVADLCGQDFATLVTLDQAR